MAALFLQRLGKQSLYWSPTRFSSLRSRKRNVWPPPLSHSLASSSNKSKIHSDLNNNFFSGSIPDSISELPLLSVLYGSHLFDIFFLQPLTYSIYLLSDLGNNFLTGSIPTFPEAPINYLWVPSSLPSYFFLLTCLFFSRLSCNQLSGSIPEELGSISSLRVLYVVSSASCSYQAINSMFFP